MTDRNNILQRVLNLRELGGRTNSEAEAFSAMKAADKLMHAYRIEEAELAMAEATGEIRVEIVNAYQGGITVGRNRHKVQACVWAIEAYCEVEVVITHARLNNDWTPQLHWIGDKPDVELAQYLTSMIRESMDRSYENWKRTQQGVGRAAKAAFQTAFAGRVNNRLRELTTERRVERQQAVVEAMRLLDVPAADKLNHALANGNLKELTTTALVVVAAAEVKKHAVDAAFKAAYGKVKLGTASGFSYRSGHTASAAGRAAGDRVNFGRPLAQSSAARRLA